MSAAKFERIGDLTIADVAPLDWRYQIDKWDRAFVIWLFSRDHAAKEYRLLRRIGRASTLAEAKRIVSAQIATDLEFVPE